MTTKPSTGAEPDYEAQLFQRLRSAYAWHSEIVALIDQRNYQELYDALLQNEKPAGCYYICMEVTSFLSSTYPKIEG
jgi:hypothetical protein